MGAWRYTTIGCQRIWRWWSVVGPAERPSLVWPCAKAALILPPLLGVPSSVAPFQGGWPWSYPYEYAAGFETPIPASAGTHPQPGEGLQAVPGHISEYATYLNSITPVIQSGPVDFVDVSQSTHVPEPSSLVVLAVGAGAAVLVKRWRG